MKSTYNPGVHKFSVFVVCWTVVLFIAGALVTSKEAALSVTDWPKSHGTWVPPLSMLQGGDFFEFSHRVVAGGLGILTLALAVLLWAKEKRPWLRWLGLVAVLGVAVQGHSRRPSGHTAASLLAARYSCLLCTDRFLPLCSVSRCSPASGGFPIGRNWRTAELLRFIQWRSSMPRSFICR